MIFSFITLPAYAALVGVLPATPGGTDYQAYYDDVADLSWLANANVNDLMNWSDASAWAASLDINGVTGWRLPESISCSGLSCTGSEMGNLFYNVLGGSADTEISADHNINYDLFSDVSDAGYWSSTEYAPDTTAAWRFGFADGSQFASFKTNTYYAWAVHSGNVGAVPVPAAVWLFGSGLLALAGIGRQSRH